MDVNIIGRITLKPSHASLRRFLYLCFHLIFQLSREVVQNINLAGGSLLGVSRGGADISEIVDSIQVIDLNMFLFFCLNSVSFPCILLYVYICLIY